MHFLTIAHCNRGQVDYKKVLRTETNKFIDWDVPFCLLKPKVSENVVGWNDQAIVLRRQGQGNTNDANMGDLDQKEKMSSGDWKYSNASHVARAEAKAATKKTPIGSLAHTFKHKSSQVNQLIRKKFDLTMERFTNGNWIEYSGKNKNVKFENHQQSTSGEYIKLDGSSNQQHHQQQQQLQQQQPNTSPLEVSPFHTALTQEINNLICFKMARRKRFAKRKISFFMPYTFVGGLFECLVPLDQKHQIVRLLLNDSHNEKESTESNVYNGIDSRRLFQLDQQFFMVLQNFPIKCDSHLSRPIAPLIAEDSTKQWFENKFHHFLNPKFVQTIPYLTTTTTTTTASASLSLSSSWLSKPLHLVTKPLKYIGFPLASKHSSDDNQIYSLALSMSNDAVSSWASKIMVNEDYNYNEIDLHWISKMVAYLANILNQLIAPLDFNKLVKGYNRANVNERDAFSSSSSGESENTKMQHLGADLEMNSLFAGALSWDQKVSLWLASFSDKYTKQILFQIESKWDKLNLD